MDKAPIRALVVLEALEGKEPEMIALLKEFYSYLRAKDYSRDLLYRDTANPKRFIHLRIWNSEEARDHAQHDPEVHRFWQKLPEVCTIVRIYEDLEVVFSTYEGMAEKHI